jgi:hypothetical protein
MESTRSAQMPQAVSSSPSVADYAASGTARPGRVPERVEATEPRGGQQAPSSSVCVYAGHVWKVFEYRSKLRWKRINPADMVPGRPHRFERVD